MSDYSDFQRLNYNKTLDSYGDWLNPFPWDWYDTLTFAKDRISIQAADQMFEKAIQELRKENIIYFRAIEWFPPRVNVHIHCLIGNSKERIAWKHGISKIEPYNPQGGARFYLAKFSLSQRVDLDYKLS